MKSKTLSYSMQSGALCVCVLKCARASVSICVCSRCQGIIKYDKIKYKIQNTYNIKYLKFLNEQYLCSVLQFKQEPLFPASKMFQVFRIPYGVNKDKKQQHILLSGMCMGLCVFVCVPATVYP